MHRCLLWSCDDIVTCASTGTQFIAPSWSWALVQFAENNIGSYNGEEFVMYGHISRGFLTELVPGYSCMVVSAESSLVSNDEYGPINSGNVVLEGRWKSSMDVHQVKMPHFLMGGTFPISIIDQGPEKGNSTSQPARLADLYLGLPENDDRQIICDMDLRMEKRNFHTYRNYQPSDEEKWYSRDWSNLLFSDCKVAVGESTSRYYLGAHLGS